MNEILWFASRATGIVSVVLLTYVLVAGLILAARRNPHRAGPTILMGLHRWVSLSMVAFLLVHVVTAIVETFVDIGWISLVVPFTSGYSPIWVGLGTLAFDLVLIIMVTSFLRPRIAERTWRAVHLLSYLMWPIAVVHGVALGTPQEWGLRAITVACGVIGIAAITWRLAARNQDGRRRAEVALQEWT